MQYAYSGVLGSHSYVTFSAQEIRRQCNTNYLDELGYFAALRA